MNRLLLEAIRVIGENKPTAEITLRSGLNVISGASDTGKSYIVEMLDFLLGASRAPKRIDESVGYTIAQLDFSTTSNSEHLQFGRALKGGETSYRKILNGKVEPADPPILSSKHLARASDSVSGVLLQACGLWGKRLLKNKDGQTRSLSFRDLSHLTIVREEQIYKTESPILVPNVVENTARKATFRLLLTGIDDSAIVQKKRKTDVKQRREAQRDILDGLVHDLEADLRAADAGDLENIADQIQKLNVSIAELSDSISVSREQIHEEQVRRQQAWEEMVAVENRLIVINELLERFTLLRKHYETDIGRLKAILELESAFEQLGEQQCPICGNKGISLRMSDPVDLEKLRFACSMEIGKIELFLKDLGATVLGLENEKFGLDSKKTEKDTQYREASRLLKDHLKPTATVSKSEFNDLVAKRRALERADSINRQLGDFRNRLTKLETEGERGATISQSESSPSTAQTQELCGEIEGVLRSWGYDEVNRVSFSENYSDIVINGRDRRSHGKGIRALTYSAFIFGLMKFCLSRNLPHPGFIVLDSPLVAYKEPDPEDSHQLPEAVKDRFYRSLAEDTGGGQVLVMENIDPPGDVASLINYHHFSRSATGRFGFYPVVPGPTQLLPEPEPSESPTALV